MDITSLLVLIIGLSLFSYFFGRKRAYAVSANQGGVRNLHSLPNYYGYMVALWCGLPAILVLSLWSAFESSIINHLLIATLPSNLQGLSSADLGLLLNKVKLLAASGDFSSATDPVYASAAQYLADVEHKSTLFKNALVIVVGLAGAIWGFSKISATYRARNWVETVIRYLLLACSMVAIITTLGIVLSVLFESIQFFKAVSVWDFMFGTTWSPQTAIRADQVGSSGAFGAVPLFVGTMLISAIAMLIAVPVGLMSAIYLSEYASKRFRSVAKPVLEVLAGIPTVVYGFFAALTVAPFIRNTGEMLGLNVASESALAAGVVMGIMIIPFVSSLSDDVIKAVPSAMRDGSYGMGATKSETIKQVIIPAALPGIVGGILLAVSRAIGETMIVVMAAGMSANLTINPLEAVTTVTVQIVTLLTGDQEFDSTKTLSAFALALMLFFTTLFLNFIALHIVKKYREAYE